MPKFLTLVIILVIGYVIGAMYPTFFNRAASALEGAAAG
jgi:hypothetical protein